jgi:hypothetical protein
MSSLERRFRGLPLLRRERTFLPADTDLVAMYAASTRREARLSERDVSRGTLPNPDA